MQCVSRLPVFVERGKRTNTGFVSFLLRIAIVTSASLLRQNGEEEATAPATDEKE